MPKAQTSSAPPVSAPTAPASDEAVTMDVEPSSFQKKGNWPLNSTPSAPVPGFKKSGWSTVGSSFYDHFSERPPSPQSNSSFGWAPSSSSATTSGSHLPPSYHTPSFRTGGCTSLDTGTATTVQSPRLMPIPPAPTTVTTSELPPSSEIPQPQPLMGGTRGGWSSISSQTVSPASDPLPPGPSPGPHSPLRQPSDAGTVHFTSSNPHVVLVSAPSQSLMKHTTPSTELERSGWQKFQSKNLKRR